MSLIGKRPVPIPQGVKVTLQGSRVQVEGPKGKVSREIPPGIQIQVEGAQAVVKKEADTREHRLLHGTTRSHLANMVTGVSQGFEIRLEINGVGYKAEVQGKELVLTVGFNHPVKISIPEGVQVKVEKQTQLSLSGANTDTVGQLAATIRRVRPADPYKEKGIKYSGEVIRRKAGKAAVAKAA